MDNNNIMAITLKNKQTIEKSRNKEKQTQSDFQKSIATTHKAHSFKFQFQQHICPFQQQQHIHSFIQTLV
jgi:uncharacterized protein YbcV (DUF1398 family)